MESETSATRTERPLERAVRRRMTLRVVERASGFYCAHLDHLLGRHKTRAEFERYIRSVSPDWDVEYVAPNDQVQAARTECASSLEPPVGLKDGE
jgi:hypothetical protein